MGKEARRSYLHDPSVFFSFLFFSFLFFSFLLMPVRIPGGCRLMARLHRASQKSSMVTHLGLLENKQKNLQIRACDFE